MSIKLFQDAAWIRVLPNYGLWRFRHGGYPDQAIQRTFDLVFLALRQLETQGVVSSSVEVTTTPYDVQEGDGTLMVNLPTETPPVINLPPGTDDRLIIIKDKKGTAATFPITVNADPGETIDGQPFLTINVNYRARQLRFLGTEWSIV